MISCPECGNMARYVGHREVRQCACGLAYGPDAGDVWRYLRQQADCGHTLPRFGAEEVVVGGRCGVWARGGSSLGCCAR
jgi:hypothetical protein